MKGSLKKSKTRSKYPRIIALTCSCAVGDKPPLFNHSIASHSPTNIPALALYAICNRTAITAQTRKGNPRVGHETKRNGIRLGSSCRRRPPWVSKEWGGRASRAHTQRRRVGEKRAERQRKG